jgi:hypothetical protein
MSRTATSSHSPVEGLYVVAHASLEPVENPPLLITQYESLRVQTARHVTVQSRLQALAIIGFIAAALAGILTKNTTAFLLFPFFALVLTVFWLRQSTAVHLIADHVERETLPAEDGLEMPLAGHVRERPLPLGTMKRWHLQSIFLGGSILTIVAGATLPGHGAGHTVLTRVSITATLVTVLLFCAWRDPAKRFSPGR